MKLTTLIGLVALGSAGVVGYDAYRKDGPLGFKTFAKKYCLIAIDDLALRRPTLDEVFLHLTKENAA